MAAYGRILFAASSPSNSWSLLCTSSSIKNWPRYLSVEAKMLKKLGIPPKPKKPLSPYIQFMKNRRKEIDEEEPHLKHTEKVAKLAQKWVVADVEEKEALRKLYDREMVAYSKQLMIYQEGITPEHKMLIAQEKQKGKVKAEKLQHKKKCIELGKPKKPIIGFMKYLQEHKDTIQKGQKTTDWVKACAKIWGEMTEAEKAKYKVDSDRLMQQYKLDVKMWEENMVRHGHIDVVRSRGLIDIKSSMKETE